MLISLHCKQLRLLHSASSDKFAWIHSNFDFSNFKFKCRIWSSLTLMAKLIKFNLRCGKIRTNSNHHLVNYTKKSLFVPFETVILAIMKVILAVKKVVFRPFFPLLLANLYKLELFFQLNAKLDNRLLSNSNSRVKFDLKFEFRIQHFQSNSDFCQVWFKIRPSLHSGAFSIIFFHFYISIFVQILIPKLLLKVI